VERALRYLRLWSGFGRFGLARELAFRGNFIVKVTVEILWLCILIFFYRTVFARTTVVANWTQAEYLFFIGCYFAVEGFIETFFLENCNEFADMVRTGDLDFCLLMPIDEQFLVTCRKIDWSTAPNLLMGAGVMTYALVRMGQPLELARVIAFLAMFACGVAIAYSFMVCLTASSIWFVRNQSLFEMWWLFTSLARYPREIYGGAWASFGWFFTYLVPILLVVNVPANAMVKVFDPWVMAFTVAATAVLLLASRRFFQSALRRYRSASS
jgi:ABC-2 type transport system permease protein